VDSCCLNRVERKVVKCVRSYGQKGLEGVRGKCISYVVKVLFLVRIEGRRNAFQVVSDLCGRIAYMISMTSVHALTDGIIQISDGIVRVG
jgi:hypothetical protein